MTKIFFIASLVLVNCLFAMSIDFFDEQKQNTSNMAMRIRINNDEERTLKNVSVRYYFHRIPEKNVVVDIYYAPNDCLWSFSCEKDHDSPILQSI